MYTSSIYNLHWFKFGVLSSNQLLTIMNLIYRSFDLDIEEGSIFLDISKVSGRLWHDGLIQRQHQWKKERATGKQRVILNG